MKILQLLTVIIFSLSFNVKAQKLNFEGDWANTKNKSQVIFIKRNGNNYLVKHNGKTHPAEVRGEFLALDSGQKAVINYENGNLVINGNEYLRVNGDLFLGNWLTRNLSIYIYKKNGKYIAILTRPYNSFSENENDVSEFDVNYKDASLNGYYAASDEGGNFKITLYGNNKIRFYAETNVSTYDYILEKSDYLPQNAFYFSGVYQGIDDAKMFKLYVKRLSSDLFKVMITDLGEWRGFYKDGFIYCIIDQRGRAGSRKAFLRFKINNTLEVEGFWNLIDNDKFEFIKVDNSNPNWLNDNNELLNKKNKDFFVISVTVTKTESRAKKEVEKLINKGYNADYLWIPDYNSLSGAEYYLVFIGPFTTQTECEVETEKYRRTNNKAYGLLISQKNIRMEIRGVGKTKIIAPYHK